MNYDEPNYYEPTQADEIINEAKEKLEAILKDSVKQEMKTLNETNNRLIKTIDRIERQNIKLIEENAELIRKAERSKFDALGLLMGERQIEMWGVGLVYHDLPKCDKCNEKRVIPYVLPSGKPAEEKCSCSIRKGVYEPIKSICYEMKKHSNDKSLMMWFKKYSEKEDVYTDGRAINNVWNGELYNEITTYEWLFKTKQEAKSYCDYLNAKVGD